MKTPTTFTSIVVAVVIITLAKFGGEWAGKETGRIGAARESQAAGTPSGLFGTTWLMSPVQVKGVVPSAVVSGDNELLELRQVFGRDAKVNYIFQKDMLVGVLVTFSGDSSRTSYDDIQQRLAAEYGPMPVPSTVDNRLVSAKTTGRFAVEHYMWETFGVQVEQEFYYRTKG
jgi:hypothetical protein